MGIIENLSLSLQPTDTFWLWNPPRRQVAIPAFPSPQGDQFAVNILVSEAHCLHDPAGSFIHEFYYQLLFGITFRFYSLDVLFRRNIFRFYVDGKKSRLHGFLRFKS